MYANVPYALATRSAAAIVTLICMMNPRLRTSAVLSTGPCGRIPTWNGYKPVSSLLNRA